MYAFILCFVLYMTYFTFLMRRYYKRRTTDDTGYLGVETFSATVIGMMVYLAAFMLITVIASHWLPYIESTSKPAVLFSVGTTQSGSEIFIWNDKSQHGTIYRMNVLAPGGSIKPYNIPETEQLRIIEDESLTNRGKVSVTTRQKDATHLLANWTVEPMRSTIVKIEVRIPKGSMAILPH